MLKLRHVALLGALAIGAFGLLACTTGSETEYPTAGQELLAQITVTHAVGKLIEAGDNPQERATKIYQHAVEARSLLAGESVTLPQLEKAVRERLTKENLSPADLHLVDSLVRAIAIDLSRRVGSEHLNADQKLAVERVLDWIIAAASLEAPPQLSQ